MKTIQQIREWIDEQIEENKELLTFEPNTSHSFTAYLSENDALYRLLEFLDEE